MDKTELETIIAIADEKIKFFDTCKVEPFPADLGESVRVMIRALSEGKPIPDGAKEVITLAENVAHQTLNYLIDNFNPTEVAPLIKNHLGEEMYSFMAHDGAHLAFSLFKIRNAISYAVIRGKLDDELKINPEFYSRKMGDNNRITQKIALMYAHPWRLIKFLAENKLGAQPKYEPVKLKEIFEDVAEVLSIRFGAEVSSIPNPATPLKRSIAVLGEDLSILADRGLLWSVVYNNLKNAQKKFDEEEVKYFQEHTGTNRNNLTPELRIQMFAEYLRSLDGERTSTVASYALNDDYITLIFSDTGSPVDLNKMVHQIRGLMQRGKVRDSDWVNPRMGQRYTAWSTNDFRFNRLTMEDITHAAFMARVGGSEIEKSITSGMGLYGTRQIVETLGGAILYTTTFKDENPLFVYILPKKPAQDRTEALQLRKNIIEEGLLKAA